MPTRTRLTTPGGAAPQDDVPVERWVRGPSIPVEPGHAPRWRRLLLPGLAGLVLGGALSAVVVLADQAASQDPSLDVPGLDQPAPQDQLPDEELPAEG